MIILGIYCAKPASNLLEIGFESMDHIFNIRFVWNLHDNKGDFKWWKTELALQHQHRRLYQDLIHEVSYFRVWGS